MRTPISLPVESLVPHAGSMSLLSRVIEGDEESIVVEADIGPDHPFSYDGEVGGWVGIEYMAQAVGAWAGWRASLRGEPPKIGFLLGSRRYECRRARFMQGETLRIEVAQVLWGETGLAQFDCRILVGGEEVVKAALTLFQPPDAKKFLQEGNDG